MRDKHWRYYSSTHSCEKGLLASDHADHFVEPVDLVGGADAQSSALVNSGDGHVKDGAAGHTIGGLATGHLDEEAEGGGLEGKAELGRGAVGGGVGEDALA